MENSKFPCSRSGGFKISNKRMVNSKEWWKRLFEIMVKEVCVPPHLCVEVLMQIFPNKILECIYTMMDIHPRSLKPVMSDPHIEELAKHFSKPDYFTQLDKNRLTEKYNYLNMAESEKISKSSIALEKRNIKMNAYRKFLHSNDLGKVSDTTSKLSVRAKIITEKIAYDFVKWLKKFEKNVEKDVIEIFQLFNITFAFPKPEEDSDSSSDSLSHTAPKKKSKGRKHTMKKQATTAPKQNNAFGFHQILKMFEIGLRNEATSSVAVEIKELPINGLKKVFESAEEVAAISKRKKEQKVMQYFQTLIPKPPVQYCKTEFVEKLESMEVIFKDITHLRSVKCYCKWLNDHPEKEKPEFLKLENMFDPALLRTSEESIEVIDSDNKF